MVADSSLGTLLGLVKRPHFRAGNGRPGQGRSRTGADGESVEIRVPPGTIVRDAEGDRQLGELSGPGERLVVARGGRGGFGNEHFKSPTNQTPREATPGGAAEERTLHLELKLIADVGLIGMPNAGKSTLLRAVSRATPKVADYPFTTRAPHLGIAELPTSPRRRARRLVIADIPGLIEGAAQGAGLGHDFLRHIERTSVLVHLIDVMPPDGVPPAERYRAIRAELAAHSQTLASKPEIVGLNKIDLVPQPDREALVRELCAEVGRVEGEDLYIVSGATGEGVAELLEACWYRVGDTECKAWH
jgi:GTP-binding protein